MSKHYSYFLLLCLTLVSPVCLAQSQSPEQSASGIEEIIANQLISRGPMLQAGRTGDLKNDAKAAAMDFALSYAGVAAGNSEIHLLNQMEFEYHLSEGGLDRFSIWSSQPLYSSPNVAHNVFLQGGYTNMDSRDTTGGDLVYRFMTPGEQHLFGAHLGFDHQWPSHHSRLTMGLDYKTSLFGARATHYKALSEWKSSDDGLEEKPMDGTEIELSGRPFFTDLPQLELFANGFHWRQEDTIGQLNDTDDIWGYRLAAELTPINAITLRVGGSNDNTGSGFSGEAAIRLNYKFGATLDDMLDAPEYDLSSVRERRFERIRRERTMRVQARLSNAAGASGPTGPDCPNIGDTCSDGSIFAGLSPDGNVRMFTTPADAGLFTWDDDGILGNEIDTTMENCVGLTEASCRTGEANTALLITEDSNNTLGGVQPHDAAQHCSDLIAHGHDDWYLPALDELGVLYDNLVDQDGNNIPGGPLGSTFGFNISGAFPAGSYWSSSEGFSMVVPDPSAISQGFSDGFQINLTHDFGLSVRCVRR